MNKIVSPEFTVNQQAREKQKNQKGVVLWFTGLSASGKTTIANALDHMLTQNKNHTYILDGDVFRGGNQNVIASIDSKKITTKEFLEYLEANLDI